MKLAAALVVVVAVAAPQAGRARDPARVPAVTTQAVLPCALVPSAPVRIGNTLRTSALLTCDQPATTVKATLQIENAGTPNRWTWGSRERGGPFPDVAAGFRFRLKAAVRCSAAGRLASRWRTKSIVTVDGQTKTTVSAVKRFAC